MTRDGYVTKFSANLDRPEIAAQRKADGDEGAPIGPWYHWVHQGVDFITLDNATREEFSDAQLRWLRGVLDRDLEQAKWPNAPVSAIHDCYDHNRDE